MRRLASPDGEEAFSCLTGSGLLAIDLRGQGGEASGLLAQQSFSDQLRGLPAPTIAVVDSPVGAAVDDLAPGRPVLGGAVLGDLAAFDVVVCDEAELDAVAEGARSAPLASLGLVQLLRTSQQRTVVDALVAESSVYSTLQGGPEFGAWSRRHHGEHSGASTLDGDPPAVPSPVLIERHQQELRITLNRPEKRNAFSAAMRDELCSALRLAKQDAAIERVVLCGAGRSFCSGGDLNEFGVAPDPATAHAVRATRSAGRMLHELRDRVEVRVHGLCAGAGVELPAFASRVVAAADTGFELPELSMGLVPGAGGTVSLPRRIGRNRTAWLAFTGARIDAETALAWGLVDSVVA